MKSFIKIFLFLVLSLFVCSNALCMSEQTSTQCQISKVRAAHILVDTKEDADAIKYRIDNGEGFTTMARKYSKCPSGENGGDLGYFERGQMVKEFEDTAFNLPVGKVSNPVHTQFGWHLIKVYDKK